VQPFVEVRHSEWFGQGWQHKKSVRPANLFEFGQYGAAPPTREHNHSVELKRLKAPHDFNCVGVAKGQVHDHEVRVASRDLLQELFCVNEVTGDNSKPAEHSAQNQPELRIIIENEGRVYSGCFWTGRHRTTSNHSPVRTSASLKNALIGARIRPWRQATA
jgi:hypothetical protein